VKSAVTTTLHRCLPGSERPRTGIADSSLLYPRVEVHHDYLQPYQWTPYGSSYVHTISTILLSTGDQPTIDRGCPHSFLQQCCQRFDKSAFGILSIADSPSATQSPTGTSSESPRWARDVQPETATSLTSPADLRSAHRRRSSASLREWRHAVIRHPLMVGTPGIHEVSATQLMAQPRSRTCLSHIAERCSITRTALCVPVQHACNETVWRRRKQLCSRTTAGFRCTSHPRPV
jgi:hypothetical protein